MNDLLGGQIDFMCDQTTNTTSQIKSGKVKAYAVTSREAGAVAAQPADDAGGGAEGLRGRRSGTRCTRRRARRSRSIDTLVKANQAALKDPGVIKRFDDLGTEPVSPDKATPAYLQKFLAAEIAKWGPIIQKAGQYAD